MRCALWITLILLSVSKCLAPGCDQRRFPDGFLLGVSSSAYQIEGAWNDDGKGESIWDHLTHYRKSFIKDRSNGDVSSNSYYLYKRDVEMLKELGVNFYRFSISWSRILPTGFANKINEKGVAYYDNLINELLANDIIPVVTLYHMDLPQKLQDMGGWTNPYIIDWFGDYARICFRLFGDRVKHWITINEPNELCYFGYGASIAAPALDIKGIAEYLCAKNVLLSHATAYHTYDKEFRPDQQGVASIIIAAQWYEPKSRSQADVEAAYDAFEFNVNQYAHPIFSNSGDFPDDFKNRIAMKSQKQGFPRSRLPLLTPDDVQFIKGTSDFFGLNHYFTEYVSRNRSVEGYYPSPSFEDDSAVFSDSAKRTDWKWHDDTQLSAPWGFYKLLQFIKTKYNNPPILILENGYPTKGGLVDEERVLYLRNYMCAMLAAIDGGCDVRGYAVWSLMDSFEWNSGYTLKMGLYQVDFSSENRTRTPRTSARVYAHVARTRALDYSYTPDVTSPDTGRGCGRYS